ncbi:MAG TPA: 6-carboxytetrahydropterin synthase QueD [Armatimonadota bacterium]|nr:6-carboxytetrahydropterin synthase QueD [Armatimonadota bacterium]
MYELTVEREISAAHCLREYEGACARVHGHNYRVQVSVTGDELSAIGMLMDFGDLKDICDAVLDGLDHADLNDIEPFDRINPTSENLARYVYEQVAERLPGPARVSRVTVYESARAWATYTESG